MSIKYTCADYPPPPFPRSFRDNPARVDPKKDPPYLIANKQAGSAMPGALSPPPYKMPEGIWRKGKRPAEKRRRKGDKYKSGCPGARSILFLPNFPSTNPRAKSSLANHPFVLPPPNLVKYILMAYLIKTKNIGQRSCKCTPLMLIFSIIMMTTSMANARPSFQQQSASSSDSIPDELFRWFTFRNATNYSPISPASPESLAQLNSSDQMLSNGLSLTSAMRVNAAEQLSSSRKMRKHRHRVDANMPFTRRAICPFQFVLNHRPNRVPPTLVEVKCLSASPSQSLLGRPLALVECEPMRWTIRILECEGETGEGKCRQSEERIPMACVPVLQANRNKEEAEDWREEGERIAAAVISVVPAEPMDEDMVPT